MNKVRLLGMDPGIVNFGIAVTELNRKKGTVKVIAHSMLKNPISDFKGDFRLAVSEYRKEIDGWIRTYQVHGFIAERFQARGLRGTSGELVSLMLGIMATRYHKLPHKYVIASTWKNDVNKLLALKGTDLKELYKEYKQVGVKAHQLDAVLMSIYGLKTATQTPVTYDWNKLINQIAQSNKE